MSTFRAVEQLDTPCWRYPSIISLLERKGYTHLDWSGGILICVRGCCVEDGDGRGTSRVAGFCELNTANDGVMIASYGVIMMDYDASYPVSI